MRTVTNGGERLTSSWDPGAATQATRNLYGYPPLHGGETVAQYDARVSWMKTRVCEFRIDNRGPNGALHAASTNQATQAAQPLKATTTTANNALQPTHTTISGNNVHHFVDPTGVAWSGNFADEPCVEATLNITCSGNAGDDYRYQDVYAYWTWNGISGTNTANGTVSQWMGEGGMTASPNSGTLPFALVQSGSENEHDAASLFQNTYLLFVEYEGKGTSYGAYVPWGMGSGAYGEYVYAEEYSDINRFNAYSTVGLPNNNTTNVIYGRTLQADPECAEAIVKDTTGAGNNVEFSTMTFNDIGVLATGYSSNAQRMDVVWHDYMTWNDSNGQLDAVGPITTDNNYSPNDDNALTWQHY